MPVPSSRPFAPPGIPGLDDILRGGFPRNRVYVVRGEPGAGKTTVGLQFLCEGARAGEKVLYVTLSETAEELRAVAASHGWSLDGVSLYYGGPRGAPGRAKTAHPLPLLGDRARGDHQASPPGGGADQSVPRRDRLALGDPAALPEPAALPPPDPGAQEVLLRPAVHDDLPGRRQPTTERRQPAVDRPRDSVPRADGSRRTAPSAGGCG